MDTNDIAFIVTWGLTANRRDNYGAGHMYCRFVVTYDPYYRTPANFIARGMNLFSIRLLKVGRSERGSATLV